jgi:hypothetical protein
MKLVLFLLIVGLILLSFLIRLAKCEGYSPVTGFSYADGCDKMPVPQNIKTSSKSPPFYNLNAVRPPFCAYRNYTFPPPLGYTPIQEAPASFDRYQYWFNDAVLSHPQTSYLV